MTINSKLKPKLGILSGAGPMAGLSLFKQSILLMQKHGAWKDHDYPEIFMLSYPFSDMLKIRTDPKIIQHQLLTSLEILNKQCDHIVIACNTLHLFLPPKKFPKLINLITLIKNKIPSNTTPLILASETSARENLHGHLLGIDCEYWNPPKSQAIINAILKGEQINFEWIYDLSRTRTVVLGCTEYSLALENSANIKNIIDPIKIAARLLCKIGLNHSL